MSQEPNIADFSQEKWVDRDGACRLFGISRSIWKRWCADGDVTCGRFVRRSRGRCKIYPIAELERLRDVRIAERGKLPDGYISREGAARIFQMSVSNWKKLQMAGRVPEGEWFQPPGNRVRIKIYAREQIERLWEAFQSVGQPYPDPERPGCYRVPVMSFSTARCEAIIDAEDLSVVAGRRWNWMDRTDGATPAVVLASPDGHVPLRRIILGIEKSNLRVAHANGNPLDCRRSNLILRNPSESSASARKAATYYGQPCTSRFKGVSLERSRGLWRASIKKDDKIRFLGRFRDELAAAQAHDDAARELFGEHAWLNFPDGIDAWLEAEAAKVQVEREAA